MVNEEVKDRIIDFKVDVRVDSDHLPLCLRIWEQEEREERITAEEVREWEDEIVVWNEKAIARYKSATEEEETEEGRKEEKEQEGKAIEECWDEIKRIVSCTKGKRKVKKLYWRWRRGKIKKEEYWLERRGYEELLKKRQREKREEEEMELKNLKREADIWKYINKKRRRKRQVENNINKEEWRDYFKELLGNEEEEGEIKAEIREVEDGDDDLKEEEIGKVRKKMKLKKAAGIDGIPVGWGIRARRFEHKIKSGRVGRLAKVSWEEKERSRWKDEYGQERKRYYNRNGWGIETREVIQGVEDLEEQLINREREV
ncbi:hypothetical protein ALC57_08321 [Trachymyrmex cornetzi]|uniref:Uncharacterized protein n=1 Tax=Trachymyrmex cornetzi TaxID=471704 RepID=A0A151J759_9HYME|nr:hypothetical protein ALC57_08321 [Trachymyrmex cornetzi]